MPKCVWTSCLFIDSHVPLLSLNQRQIDIYATFCVITGIDGLTLKERVNLSHTYCNVYYACQCAIQFLCFDNEWALINII